MCTFSVFAVHSQEVTFDTPFHHLSFESGLPSSQIYSVLQDSKGNMWFSTDAGVVKYDGYFFKVYGTDDGLINNVVFEAVEDKSGRIWFLSLANELCYLQDDKIIPYKYNHVIRKHTGEATAKSKFIVFDASGNLHYSLGGFGLIRIDLDGKLTLLHKTPGTYQITTVDGQNLPSFQNFRSYNRGERDASYYVAHIRPDSSTMIGPLITYNRNTYVKSINELSLTVVSKHLVDLNNGRILAKDVYKCLIDPIQKDVFWIIKTYGVQKCTYKDGKVDFGDIHLDEQRPTDICWDSEGGMWVSTLENGMYYCSNFEVTRATMKTGLFGKSVMGIGELNNEMYFSFLGGYQRMGARPKIYRTLQSFSLICSAENHLIVSEDTKFPKVTLNNQILTVPYSRDIICRNNSVYYIFERLLRYNIQTNQVDTLYDGLSDLSQSKQNYFRAVEVLPNGKIIVGGRFGLSQVKNKQLTNDYRWSRKFDVRDMVYSKKFGLLIGTNNSGLVFSSNGKFDRKLDVKTGLASNKVRCVLELDSGILLIGTNAGLNYISAAHQTPELISENFGIKGADILSLYANKSHVYVGTQVGVYRIRKSVFTRKLGQSNAEIYIGNVFVDDQRLEEIPQVLELPYQTGRLRVRFRTTNFKKWVNKRYQYRLSKEEDWIDISSPEISIYKPLGEFNLEVRFQDENNKWSPSKSILKCAVHVPFWKQWYFVSFIIFVFGGIIIFLILRRQRAVRRRLRMENEMLSLEQRMQNARMNPHFVFNVLNSIHSFILFEDKESAEKYLIKFSELMRNTLNETVEGSILIRDEVTILNKYLELEELRSANRFAYEIVNLVEQGNLRIPTMIIQPIIENAIIHGVSSIEKDGFVSVHLRTKNQKTLIVEIFNNGDISKEQIDKARNAGLNNATGITNKRLSNYNLLFKTDEYGMVIERITEGSGGTKFTLTIPLIE